MSNESGVVIQQQQEKKKVKLSLGWKVIIMAEFPLIILAVGLTIYSAIILIEGMRQEATSGLSYLANSIRASYSEFAEGDYYLDEDGSLMKGELNVTERMDILDSFVAGTDADATIFFGDMRMTTTLISKDTGERIVGTEADPVIANKVLNQGDNYIGYQTKINGLNYYAYYEPLYNQDGSIVGMVFVGIPSNDINEFITTEITKIVITALFITIIVVLIMTTFCIKLGKALRKLESTLQTIGSGDLTVAFDEKLEKRTDEIGVIMYILRGLVSRLRTVIGDIKQSAMLIHSNGESLETTAVQTSTTSDEISSAVEDISKGAVSQAEDIERATGAVSEIGRIIENIVVKVDNLTGNSRIMGEAGDRATQIMEELRVSNDRTTSAVGRVSETVKQTDTSVQQIREAVAMITSIASQTSLLSLNASIEAARAGEAGRGFAVVAGEIQKLAEESNQSAQRIEDIIFKLLDDSQRALEVMGEVQENVDEQRRKMEETRERFLDVQKGIQSSSEDIGQVSAETKNCNEHRVQIVDLIQNLSAVSEENAASTQETTASMQELNATMNLLAQSSQELLKMADQLDEETAYFTVD